MGHLPRLLHPHVTPDRTTEGSLMTDSTPESPQGVDRNARPTKRDRRQFEKLRGRDLE